MNANEKLVEQQQSNYFVNTCVQAAAVHISMNWSKTV